MTTHLLGPFNSCLQLLQPKAALFSSSHSLQLLQIVSLLLPSIIAVFMCVIVF